MIMFGGSSNVSRDSGSVYGQIYVGDDSVVPAFRRLAVRLHAYGAAVMCQITHMGRRTVADAGEVNANFEALRAAVDDNNSRGPRAMTKVISAVNATTCGHDFTAQMLRKILAHP